MFSLKKIYEIKNFLKKVSVVQLRAMSLDILDMKIIQHLTEDGKTTYRSIAEDT